MTTTLRVIGTILILLGALIALKLGFAAISAIGQPVRLVLSALLFFFAVYAFMRLANRIWGKNIFSSEAS